MEANELKALLRELFEEEGWIGDAQLAQKWIGGTLILKPEDLAKAPKEIPLDIFFHKIVMVRDRLRVLEQKINTNKKLDDADKIDLQQYITRIYGSLTSFNVLFKDKADHFSGERKDSGS